MASVLMPVLAMHMLLSDFLGSHLADIDNFGGEALGLAAKRCLR
ncbi:hypothetical protein ACPRNU_22740 [Chromobacterium vaccinii]